MEPGQDALEKLTSLSRLNRTSFEAEKETIRPRDESFSLPLFGLLGAASCTPNFG